MPESKKRRSPPGGVRRPGGKYALKPFILPLADRAEQTRFVGYKVTYLSAKTGRVVKSLKRGTNYLRRVEFLVRRVKGSPLKNHTQIVSATIVKFNKRRLGGANLVRHVLARKRHKGNRTIAYAPDGSVYFVGSGSRGYRVSGKSNLRVFRSAKNDKGHSRQRKRNPARRR